MKKALRILGWLCLALMALIGIAMWWGYDEKGLYAGFYGAAVVVGGYVLINDIIVNPLKAEMRAISMKLDAIEKRLRR